MWDTEETTASPGEQVRKWCVVGQPVRARSLEMGVRDDRLRVPGAEDGLLETSVFVWGSDAALRRNAPAPRLSCFWFLSSKVA